MHLSAFATLATVFFVTAAFVVSPVFVVGIAALAVVAATGR